MSTRGTFQQQIPQQPLHKLIFRGRLEFGNQRSYDIVAKHWATRMETYFKNDVLFKSEDVLLPDDFALEVPQSVINSTEKTGAARPLFSKSWLNTPLPAMLAPGGYPMVTSLTIV